jgi:hypothetical protein
VKRKTTEGVYGHDGRHQSSGDFLFSDIPLRISFFVLGFSFSGFLFTFFRARARIKAHDFSTREPPAQHSDPVTRCGGVGGHRMAIESYVSHFASP